MPAAAAPRTLAANASLFLESLPSGVVGAAARGLRMTSLAEVWAWVCGRAPSLAVPFGIKPLSPTAAAASGAESRIFRGLFLAEASEPAVRCVASC